MSEEVLDVVGIGSMVVDRVHRTPRIVEADEKAVLRDVEDAGPVRNYVGGVVLNHLGWAAALGLRTGICGRQGQDEGGRFLRDAMDWFRIERHLDLTGSATSVSEIFVDDAGGRAIYMARAATAETTPDHVRCDHAAFIRRGRCLTTEVSQLPLASAAQALEIAREAGMRTVVDLDVPPSDALATLGNEASLEAVLRGAWLIKPSKSAARELAPELGGDALALARRVRERFAANAVAVTDGEAGCAISADDFEGFVPSNPVKAVDTTGAGDAFLGGLLAGLHYGLGWEASAKLANACGAACVERLGAFPDNAVTARARVLELYAGPEVELGPLPSERAVQTRNEPAHEALATLDVALEELSALRDRLDPPQVEKALALFREVRSAGGRVHVTGVGKPEYVAGFAASILSSTGTAATFLHATEAVHGSAGQLVEGDLVIAISNSGETREILDTVDAVRGMGARVLAVTGGLGSSLARAADAVLDAGVTREGGLLGLAPRASVAAEILVLAAVASALEGEVGFSRAEYLRRHPAGALGKRSNS